jgi:hypothetical protein
VAQAAGIDDLIVIATIRIVLIKNIEKSNMHNERVASQPKRDQQCVHTEIQ